MHIPSIVHIVHKCKITIASINQNGILAAYSINKEAKMTKRKLLTIGNAKTTKGEKLGILTGILYFAPAMISGRQVCPKASDGCKAACLYTAGRGRFTKTQEARIAKTKLFFDDRKLFMSLLVDNVSAIVRKAERESLQPAIRLNGTSDIAWEKISVMFNGERYRNIMSAFPNVQFYDYTKISGRKAALALDNYHLTFSLSENNDNEAFEALKQGYNLAVVMDLKRNDPKPTLWAGYPVVDGDLSDVRFLDPARGHIVALSAKGDAKKDTTCFVRTSNVQINIIFKAA